VHVRLAFMIWLLLIGNFIFGIFLLVLVHAEVEDAFDAFFDDTVFTHGWFWDGQWSRVERQ
jgi:hypothetical protein